MPEAVGRLCYRLNLAKLLFDCLANGTALNPRRIVKFSADGATGEDVAGNALIGVLAIGENPSMKIP